MFVSSVTIIPHVFVSLVVRHVSGIDICTASEVEVVNGTDVELRCTFRSSYTVSHKSVSVTWLFQGLNPGAEEAVCDTGSFCNAL